MGEQLLVMVTAASVILPPNSFPNRQKAKASLPKRCDFLTRRLPSSSIDPPLLCDLSRYEPLGRHVRYYADLASRLASRGRIDDFLMISEMLLASGIEAAGVLDIVNVELVSAGVTRFLRDGKLMLVFEALGKFERIGLRPSSLLDAPSKELIGRECLRLVDGGRIEEFIELMEGLAGYGFSVKELVEPYAILKVCVKQCEPHLAVRYANIFPHVHALFCFIIQEFGKKKDLTSALIVFEASNWKSDTANMYVFRSIIDTCGLCGDFLRSRYIFEELLAKNITPNVYVFNSLMNVNAHDLSYSLHIYNHMQTLGIVPDVATFNILLKTFCLAGRVDLAQDIYKEVQHLAALGVLKMDIVTYSTIIKVFADAKMWQMAMKIKDDMLSAGVNPNMVTWSSLISAFANAGLIEAAIYVFEEMHLVGYKPNIHCCNTLLHACVEACQYDRAFRFFRSWLKAGIQKTGNASDSNRNEHAKISALNSRNGSSSQEPHSIVGERRPSSYKAVPFRPTVATYNILMKACGTDFCRAKALMVEMRTMGLCPNQISWSILINICGRAHNIRGAMEAFKSMLDAGVTPDVVAYTTAIKVCVEDKSFKKAFSLFKEMKRCGIQPNLVTYSTLLRARSSYGSLEEVRQCLEIYQDMRKAGYGSNDYFLKKLLEEWCEEVLTNGEQRPIQMLDASSLNGKNERSKSRSIVLEKVADFLRRGHAMGSLVDLQGLSKVEARIVVLAVLRMYKETYIQGETLKEDLILITGVGRIGTNYSESAVHGVLIKVLHDELGLEVTAMPRITPHSKEERNPDHTHRNCGNKFNFQDHLETVTRRPMHLGRLVISRKSLQCWLQKRIGLSKLKR